MTLSVLSTKSSSSSAVGSTIHILYFPDTNYYSSKTTYLGSFVKGCNIDIDMLDYSNIFINQRIETENLFGYDYCNMKIINYLYRTLAK